VIGKRERKIERERGLQNKNGIKMIILENYSSLEP
jgi:hypothetical protein